MPTKAVIAQPEPPPSRCAPTPRTSIARHCIQDLNARVILQREGGADAPPPHRRLGEHGRLLAVGKSQRRRCTRRRRRRCTRRRSHRRRCAFRRRRRKALHLQHLPAHGACLGVARSKLAADQVPVQRAKRCHGIRQHGVLLRRPRRKRCGRGVERKHPAPEAGEGAAHRRRREAISDVLPAAHAHASLPRNSCAQGRVLCGGPPLALGLSRCRRGCGAGPAAG